MAWGLNGAALALLGAVLAAGTEPGGLGARWTQGWVPFVMAGVAGTVGGRFPRSLGLPLLVVTLGLGFAAVRALDGFVPPEHLRTLEVQPLTDREMVTAFVLRADWLELPPAPLVPRTLCRLRAAASPPRDWWWAWAAQWGWARSTGAGVPTEVLKLGVYRLEVADGTPTWRLVAPDVDVPD